MRDDADAADVVQESYLRAYRHLKQFSGRAKFSTWLTKIAIYEARARARRIAARGGKTREPSAMKTWNEPATEADSERRVFVGEMKTIIEAAIDELPAPYRMVFVMRSVDEMSTADTAECLNLSQDAVKTRLRRARALLRKSYLPTTATPHGACPTEIVATTFRESTSTTDTSFERPLAV